MLPFGLTRKETGTWFFVTCPKLRTGEGRCQAWPAVALVAVLRVWGQAGWAPPLASLLWWRDKGQKARDGGCHAPTPPLSICGNTTRNG